MLRCCTVPVDVLDSGKETPRRSIFLVEFPTLCESLETTHLTITTQESKTIMWGRITYTWVDAHRVGKYIFGHINEYRKRATSEVLGEMSVTLRGAQRITIIPVRAGCCTKYLSATFQGMDN